MARATALLLGASLSGSAAEGAAPGRDDAAWRDTRAGSGPFKDWAACVDLLALPAVVADDPSLEDEPAVQVRRRSDGVDAYVVVNGSGRWAARTITVFRLEHHSCTARGYTIEGAVASMIGGLRHFSVGNAPACTIQNVPGLPEPVVVTSAQSAELAAARMLVQLAREDEGEAGERPASSTGRFGPAWPIQPEHAGLPRGSPAARWSPVALQQASVQNPWLSNEDGQRFDAIYTWPVPAPVPLLRRGRWQLWELRFGSRLGGGLLAAFDRQSRRHRWVFATVYDDGASTHSHAASTGDTRRKGHFDVLLLDGDLLLLRTIFDKRQFLWAMDLARGVTRQVTVREDVTLRRVPEGLQLRTADGDVAVIPPAELRP